MGLSKDVAPAKSSRRRSVPEGETSKAKPGCFERPFDRACLTCSCIMSIVDDRGRNCVAQDCFYDRD